MGFVRKHWRGQYTLALSFWGVFLLLSCVYHFIEPYFLSLFSKQSEVFIATTISYLIITRLLIFPWQIVGLLRSANAYYIKFGRTLILYSVQGIVIASLIITVSHVITVAQTLVFYKENVDFYASKKDKLYSIELLDNAQKMVLKGILDFGVSQEVDELLEANPSVTAIVLESDGGQIYEGRGLAITISKHALDVYTYEKCFSACTTAFIGGEKRFLGEGGKLGFHQYGFDPERRRELTQFHDLEAEQEKERALFKSKSIDDSFIDQMFGTPTSSMWFPSVEELINAGVIDGTVTSTPVTAADSE